MITQQLPSCFLLLLDLHGPQPWDIMSSLFVGAALPLNMSPLTHFSRVLLCLGWPVAWVPWTDMKQQGEAGCTRWHFGICAASMGSQFMIIRCTLTLSDVGVSRWSPPTPAQASGINYPLPGLSWMQSSYYPLWTLPCLSSSFCPLPNSNEPWRQELPATEYFSYKLSLSKHLKKCHQAPHILLQCVNADCLLQGKQSFSHFHSDAVGAVVGLEWTSLAMWSIRAVKRDEWRQEASRCNGAVGLQEVALEPDHTVAPDPLPHFQQRETHSSFYNVLISRENNVCGNAVCRLSVHNFPAKTRSGLKA